MRDAHGGQLPTAPPRRTQPELQGPPRGARALRPCGRPRPPCFPAASPSFHLLREPPFKERLPRLPGLVPSCRWLNKKPLNDARGRGRGPGCAVPCRPITQPRQPVSSL